MDLKDLKKITAHCIKNNIKHIKIEGIELNFDQAAFDKKLLPDSPSDPSIENKLTQEDILLWSAGQSDFGGEQ